MELPEELSAALAAADEDYLVGLCNKGTVNRAKKDLAALTDPECTPENNGVTVRLGEAAVCFITAPLGESRCSCPSSAVCRHRIAAILWLKQQLDAGPADPLPPPKPVFQELRAYPPEKLAKQLGPKRLSATLFRWQSGGGPEITETSVVTVEMPWLPASVRLLEPLEHSTCTCHSKAFCPHRAEGLLYWQLKEGIADPACLETQPTGSDLDLDAVHGVCRAVREVLAAQMATGLSRMPPVVCETTERMAALCHTAKLPELERALRGLHGEYAAYFARSATYRDAALLQRISAAFRLAGALETADGETAPALAGTFRDDYLPVGDLRLYLLGMREFSGRGGYAGTIYYFWERDARRFYTFTHVRPTFYETGSNRRFSPAVPWGLPGPLHQAWNFSLDLTHARATRTGNLSASEQCQATLLDAHDPGSVYPRDLIYTDFGLLFEQRGAPHAPELERLAVICPRRCEPQAYDTVRQLFTMCLLDDKGRDLWLEVRYKKEEAKVVDRLEELADSLKKKPFLSPVFFGAVYREDDRLKLYPIEFFTEWGKDA